MWRLKTDTSVTARHSIKEHVVKVAGYFMSLNDAALIHIWRSAEPLKLLEGLNSNLNSNGSKHSLINLVLINRALNVYPFKTSFPDLNMCIPNPCKNGGQCLGYAGGYKCLCPAGYKGNNCDGKFLYYP